MWKCLFNFIKHKWERKKKKHGNVYIKVFGNKIETHCLMLGVEWRVVWCLVDLHEVNKALRFLWNTSHSPLCSYKGICMSWGVCVCVRCVHVGLKLLVNSMVNEPESIRVRWSSNSFRALEESNRICLTRGVIGVQLRWHTYT